VNAPVAQEREEVLLVRQQLVEAAIQRVVGDRPVAAKKPGGAGLGGESWRIAARS